MRMDAKRSWGGARPGGPPAKRANTGEDGLLEDSFLDVMEEEDVDERLLEADLDLQLGEAGRNWERPAAEALDALKDAISAHLQGLDRLPHLAAHMLQHGLMQVHLKGCRLKQMYITRCSSCSCPVVTQQEVLSLGWVSVCQPGWAAAYQQLCLVYTQVVVSQHRYTQKYTHMQAIARGLLVT